MLEDTGEGVLIERTWSDRQGSVEDSVGVVRRTIPVNIDDADAGKETRSEFVDSQLLWREKLRVCTVDLFPQKPEGFRDAQIGFQHLRVRNRGHMAAGVQMVVKARDVGVRVRSNGRVMLVVILHLQGVLRTGVPIEMGNRLIGPKARGPRTDGVIRDG